MNAGGEDQSSYGDLQATFLLKRKVRSAKQALADASFLATKPHGQRRQPALHGLTRPPPAVAIDIRGIGAFGISLSRCFWHSMVFGGTCINVGLWMCTSPITSAVYLAVKDTDSGLYIDLLPYGSNGLMKATKA